MKVLDIISEGVGSYVWKVFSKETIKHAVAREAVEEIASNIFRNYTRRGVSAPDGIVQNMLSAHPAYEGMDEATRALAKREISKYHNHLVDEFKKAKIPGKEGAADLAKGALSAGWAKLGTVGLLNTVFFAWAAKDIYDMVDVYRTNMQAAFEALEKGQRGEEGGISLEAFHMYHKEQLTQLVAQLILTKPARFLGIPVLGWIGRFFNSGGAGRVAWLAFIDSKVFDGPDGKMSVRNYIDNFCLWNLKGIPLIGPFLPDVTISDVVGEKLKWGEDVIMEAWVDFLKNTFYKGKPVPESLLPPGYVGPTPANAEDKKKYAPPNAAKVTPAAADGQDGTNPTKNTDKSSEYADQNWRDLGNGFDGHVHTGAIRVSPGANKR